MQRLEHLNNVIVNHTYTHFYYKNEKKKETLTGFEHINKDSTLSDEKNIQDKTRYYCLEQGFLVRIQNEAINTLGEVGTKLKEKAPDAANRITFLNTF